MSMLPSLFVRLPRDRCFGRRSDNGLELGSRKFCCFICFTSSEEVKIDRGSEPGLPSTSSTPSCNIENDRSNAATRLLDCQIQIFTNELFSK
eukprot:m.40741 g.40741  ORF g.40741 m.40741 type:complete len:92 (+) comp33008_c0_seq1:2175-2450(+)